MKLKFDENVLSVALAILAAVIGGLVGLVVNVADHWLLLLSLLPIIVSIYVCVSVQKSINSKTNRLDAQLHHLERFTSTIIDDEISIKEFKRELIITQDRDCLKFVSRTTRVIQNNSDEVYPNFEYHIVFQGVYDYKSDQKAVVNQSHEAESKIIERLEVTDVQNEKQRTEYGVIVDVSIPPHDTKSLVIEQDVTNSFQDAVEFKKDYIGIKPEYQTDYLEITIINETKDYEIDVEPDSLQVTNPRGKRDLRYESKMIKRSHFEKSYTQSVWDPIRYHTFRFYFKLKRK